MARLFNIQYWPLLFSVAALALAMATWRRMHIQLESAAAGGAEYKVYFVYMRSNNNIDELGNRTHASHHLHILSQIFGSANRAQGSLIYSYKHALNGFSALLTEDHVKTLAARKEVVRILPSQVSDQLFTTNSWDFLGLSAQDSAAIGSKNPTIIGVIDTGVWPELPSFNDDQMDPIPTRWKGKCDSGADFPTSYCNRKLIGARYYNAGWRATFGRIPDEPASALDVNSHGTHVATTAGGCVVANVQVLNGLIRGTARGGNPLARLAVYKVFWETSYVDVDVVAAIDDAIDDGVDIINLSLGASTDSDYLRDPIAVASFSAMRSGILTVCAAGNSGPQPSTIVNTAPWVLTVAATTTNRDVVTLIQLGNNEFRAGFSMFLANMPLEWYELVSGEDIPTVDSLIGRDNSRHCRLGSLDQTRAIRKIVLCEQAHGVMNEPSISDKCNYLKQISAAGMVIVDDTKLSSAPLVPPFDFPFTIVSSLVGSDISTYIQSTGQPLAKILHTDVVFNEQAAPAVAGFSSRGPNTITRNILKPDISAPGVDILAGYSPRAQDPLYMTGYGLMSGTSMAAPHVSGMASLVRAYNGFANPWSPAALKSALMTTAISTNNRGEPILTDWGAQASPFDYGCGCLQPLRAIAQPGPGLIYNAGLDEYIKFLCYMGYSELEINSVFLRPSETAVCPSESEPELISQINLPSIAIADLPTGTRPVSIRRTVTNVGAAQSTYTPTIVNPPGVIVEVSPASLQFSTSEPRLTYTLQLQRSSSWPVGSVFGSITWSDGTHHVHSPIAIHSIAGSLRMEDM